MQEIIEIMRIKNSLNDEFTIRFENNIMGNKKQIIWYNNIDIC